MNDRRWRIVLAVLLFCGVSLHAHAQSTAGNPPEILTSELSLQTLLEKNRVEVNFVVVDTERVTAVSINGQAQRITPGDTVLVTRVFDFPSTVSKVEVTATNAKGLTRTVVYTIYPPGTNPSQLQGPAGEEQLTYFASYKLYFENDDNPSNDLSSPISIGDLELTGVVPDDQQTDSRTNLLISGGATKGRWTAFAGVADIAYGKAENSDFDVRSIFLGGQYVLLQGETSTLLLSYVFNDVDLGGFDYNQAHTVSPIWRRSGSHDEGEGTWTSAYSLDLTQKTFARSDLQEDASTWVLKREYNSLDAEKLDNYRSIIAYGTSSEGIAVSEYTFLSFAFDWNNRWDAGFLLNFGLGVQHRDYDTDTPLVADTPLGDTRVDIPLEYSMAAGWQFSPRVRILGSYSYVFNLSNKSPYVRVITGIGVEGSF